MEKRTLRLAGYGAVTLLAAFAYLHGLASPHIPKNGDEYPYTHITRLTAVSGRLLPLASELPGIRNTKPPLLFWQGIASTSRGRAFDLWHLRYPSVVYTLLTGLLVLLLGRRISGDTEVGFAAALSYLAFFGVYRYGRPFLTNAPESFWLFLPLFGLLYGRPASFASRIRVPVLVGIATGVGLLYKSFALVAPVALGLALLHLRQRQGRIGAFLRADAVKVAAAALIALGLFGLWLAADPDPRAVWNEFVLGENLGKFHLSGYLSELVWGRFSVAALALGSLALTGLLLPPTLALVLFSLRRRHELSEVERMLWLWILAFFLAFCLPSQRSSRYLLPALPALALLLGLHWQRLRRGVLLATLALGALPLVVIAGLSLRLQATLPGPSPYGAGHWTLLAVAAAAVSLALLVPRLARTGVHATVFLTFLAFSSLVRPLDGPLGRFDEGVQRQLAGRDVHVPVDFVAKEEGYRLLLPGARVHGYPAGRDDSVDALLARHPLVVVRLRAGRPACAACRVIGERFDLRGRHSARELRELLAGNVVEQLLVREVVVEAGPS